MEIAPPGGAFHVTEPSQVATVRRAAQRLADQLAFDETRAGRLAIVVTELATNLARHARHGQVLLRVLGPATAEPSGVEVIAFDRGPGIHDLRQSRVDGYSTAGSLGQGLGAIERQSDLFDVYTHPSGTAVLGRVYRDADARAEGPLQIGAVRVNAPGEQVCGDDFGALIDAGGALVLVADGLGHGLQAHDAARRAVEMLPSMHDRRPADVLAGTHAALHGTRGAAVLVVRASRGPRGVGARGVGNGSASILTAEGRTGLVSLPGTAGVGVTIRTQAFTSPYPPGSMIVLHTDGIRTQWDLSTYPGLGARHPSLIAAVLYRDHARGRDDATAVVVKDFP